MGLYKRPDSKCWWMSYTVDGRQHCESCHTTNRREAQNLLTVRQAEIFQGRFRLPKSNPPGLEQWSQEFLDSIRHQNTKKRYASSVASLRTYLGDVRLSDISPERIDEFKDARLAAGVRSATVNRDLAVLRRMLRIAERRRLIASSPFREVEMLEERKERRQPHIVTFEEEAKLLAVAPDHLRVLVILILETGLRSGREALALKWEEIDFASESIRVKQSKTQAGIRNVPMSSRCKAVLLSWRERLGPEFSEYVFANPQQPTTPLWNVRRVWARALKAAGLEFFWIYDLRHTFASRLTQAGVSPIFVAQMMGHSSPSILQTYAKAIDEYRRDAIKKLETFRSGRSALTQAATKERVC